MNWRRLWSGFKLKVKLVPPERDGQTTKNGKCLSLAVIRGFTVEEESSEAGGKSN